VEIQPLLASNSSLTPRAVHDHRRAAQHAPRQRAQTECLYIVMAVGRSTRGEANRGIIREFTAYARLQARGQRLASSRGMKASRNILRLHPEASKEQRHSEALLDAIVEDVRSPLLVLKPSAVGFCAGDRVAPILRISFSARATRASSRTPLVQSRLGATRGSAGPPDCHGKRCSALGGRDPDCSWPVWDHGGARVCDPEGVRVWTRISGLERCCPSRWASRSTGFLWIFPAP